MEWKEWWSSFRKTRLEIHWKYTGKLHAESNASSPSTRIQHRFSFVHECPILLGRRMIALFHWKWRKEDTLRLRSRKIWILRGKVLPMKKKKKTGLLKMSLYSIENELRRKIRLAYKIWILRYSRVVKCCQRKRKKDSSGLLKMSLYSIENGLRRGICLTYVRTRFEFCAVKCCQRKRKKDSSGLLKMSLYSTEN